MWGFKSGADKLKLKNDKWKIDCKWNEIRQLIRIQLNFLFN